MNIGSRPSRCARGVALSCLGGHRCPCAVTVRPWRALSLRRGLHRGPAQCVWVTSTSGRTRRGRERAPPPARPPPRPAPPHPPPPTHTHTHTPTHPPTHHHHHVQAQGNARRDLAARHPLDLCLDPGACACFHQHTHLMSKGGFNTRRACLLNPPPPPPPPHTHTTTTTTLTTPAPATWPVLVRPPQTRLILPAWLGVGEALLAAAASGKREVLRDMYEVSRVRTSKPKCAAQRASCRPHNAFLAGHTMCFLQARQRVSCRPAPQPPPCCPAFQPRVLHAAPCFPPVNRPMQPSPVLCCFPFLQHRPFFWSVAHLAASLSGASLAASPQRAHPPALPSPKRVPCSTGPSSRASWTWSRW